MKFVEKIYDASTGEESIIEREMTKEEIDRRNAFEKLVKKEQVEAQAKAEAKTALLEKLGITEEEAKLLLG